MGLARKLRKRADRFARVGKAKAEKRERKVDEKIVLTAKHREKEVEEIEQETWKHLQLMALTALREQRHFGGQRLNRMFRRVSVIARCVHDDDITERQMVEILQKEAHYHANICELDIADDRSVRLHALQRIFLYFAWGLFYEFDFGARRIASVWHACAEIGKELADGKRTVASMEEMLTNLPRFRWGEEEE